MNEALTKIDTITKTLSPKNNQHKYLSLCCLVLYYALINDSEQLQSMEIDYLSEMTNYYDDDYCYADWEKQPNYIVFNEFVEYINSLQQTELDAQKRHQLIMDYFNQRIIQELDNDF